MTFFTHAHVPAASALTGTSVDERIRPGLRLAFPLPPQDDLDGARGDRLRALLAALDAPAQDRSGQEPRPA